MLLHLQPPRRSPLVQDYDKKLFPLRKTTSDPACPAANLPEEVIVIILNFLIGNHHPLQGNLPCEIRRVLRGCSLISFAWLLAVRHLLFENFPVPRTMSFFQRLKRIWSSPNLTIDGNEVKILDVKGSAPVNWTQGPAWVHPAERERVQNLANTLDHFLNWVARNPESGGPTFANLRELRLSEMYFRSSLLFNSGEWVVLTHRTQYSVAHSFLALKRLDLGRVRFLNESLFTSFLGYFHVTLEELILDRVEIDTYRDFSEHSEIPSSWLLFGDAPLPRLRELRVSRTAIHVIPLLIPAPNLHELFVDMTGAQISKKETLEALIGLACSSQCLNRVTVQGASYQAGIDDSFFSGLLSASPSLSELNFHIQQHVFDTVHSPSIPNLNLVTLRLRSLQTEQTNLRALDNYLRASFPQLELLHFELKVPAGTTEDQTLGRLGYMMPWCKERGCLNPSQRWRSEHGGG
ncbi:hypothetical protein AAF712_006266 [Marasmius tenuissimus]|uniref:F-box domain-containing protein n=1 Tax=Marasmius tenuissimus TaxID=585030 RepID=A0ABR3A0W2_9AGAR